VSSARLDHAISAFLQQEFSASVTAINGFIDILIEDARRPELADFTQTSNVCGSPVSTFPH
jgi:hypothetical protein